MHVDAILTTDYIVRSIEIVPLLLPMVFYTIYTKSNNAIIYIKNRDGIVMIL
jgi:hypothetical protein